VISKPFADRYQTKKNKRKKHNLRIYLAAALLALFLLMQISSASTAAEYVLTADQIIFREEENTILFKGNALFESADFSVSADQMLVNRERKTVKGENNIVIKTADNEIFGDSLEFNYENEEGTLYGAESRIGELNIAGSRLEITSFSPVEGFLDDAFFTPCIREEPHYHFKAREIVINPDNTLDIFSIIPHIAGIPVFYLPYYSVRYSSEDGEESLVSTYPLPTVGYEQGVGVTVEFSYPYQINEKNSGRFYYWKGGDSEKDINFRHDYKITDNLNFRARYDYLYRYDTEDDVLDDEEEEAAASLAYRKGPFDIETGLFRDLLKDEEQDLYFIDSGYSFKNGIRADLRQEYSSEERTAESYSLKSSRWWLNWNLKYVDGESYNYYPYLSLSTPRYFGFRPNFAFGRVENGGIELDKYRSGYNFSWSRGLPFGFSYHLNHSFRFDHYKSGYDQNYYYRRLNTGFRYSRNLGQRLSLNSSLFYQENTVTGKSPLPDDREDEDELLKPSLSIDLKGELPQSAWSLDSDAVYDLNTEEWDEITVRVRKKEDCFNAFVGYEFIDESIVFGLEL